MDRLSIRDNEDSTLIGYKVLDDQYTIDSIAVHLRNSEVRTKRDAAYHKLNEISRRLADYEDIGLTPDQIREVDKLYSELCKELGEYKKLENRGMLVKLPFEIGDIVYCIHKNMIVTDKVEDYDIWSLRKGIHLRITLKNYKDYIVGKFGEDIFLTRAEAEVMLEYMEGMQHGKINRKS